MLLVLSDAYRRQYGFDSCAPVIANLFGPNDNYDLEDSHVIAAMIRKYVEAVDRGEPQVTNWGTGSPTREFLYVDDAARALILAGEKLETSEPVNIGTGAETSIRELAETIAELTGFEGKTVWDSSRPDGQPSRYLDVSRARELIGFEAEVDLSEGLEETVRAYRADPVRCRVVDPACARRRSSGSSSTRPPGARTRRSEPSTGAGTARSAKACRPRGLGPRLELGSGPGFAKDVIPESSCPTSSGRPGTSMSSTPSSFPSRMDRSARSSSSMCCTTFRIRRASSPRRCGRSERAAGRHVRALRESPLLSVYRFIHEERCDMSVDPLAPAPGTGDDPFEGNQAVPSLLMGRYRGELERRFPELRLDSASALRRARLSGLWRLRSQGAAADAPLEGAAGYRGPAPRGRPSA